MPDEYSIGRLKGKFVVSWWEDGKRRRYRLEAESRAEATSEAIVVIQRETVKAAGCSVKTLWELYRREKDGRRVANAMKSEGTFILPFFGSLHPDSITVDLCRAYVSIQKAPPRAAHDGTIWTELGHLRSVLVWAVKRKHIVTAPEIERPSKPAPRDRWLTEPEIRKLLTVETEPHINLAIHLMLSTAGRVSAVLDLTWDRVDLERRQIDLRLPDSILRKGRAVVPINDGLLAALSVAKASAITDYVIEWGGKQVGNIKTGFYRAVENAGLTGVSPHVLRHTAAVHMVAGGIPLQKVSQYLGHSDTRITEKVYARFAPEHLQEAATVLDFTTRLRIVR